MKVITVGFDVVVCPEFSSFRSGSGCSTPLILHMGNPAVIRIGRAGGEIDFICRIIDVTKMLFVWNIKSHFRGYGQNWIEGLAICFVQRNITETKKSVRMLLYRLHPHCTTLILWNNFFFFSFSSFPSHLSALTQTAACNKYTTRWGKERKTVGKLMI